MLRTPNRYSARLSRAYRGEGVGPVSAELAPVWRVGRFGQETSRAYHGPNGRRLTGRESQNGTSRAYRGKPVEAHFVEVPRI